MFLGDTSGPLLLPAEVHTRSLYFSRRAYSRARGRRAGRDSERTDEREGSGSQNDACDLHLCPTPPLPPATKSNTHHPPALPVVARAWAGAGRGETLKSGSQVSGPQGAAGHSQSRLLVEHREEGAWRRRGALAAAAVGCGQGWSWGLRCGKSRCPPGPEEPRSGAVN